MSRYYDFECATYCCAWLTGGLGHALRRNTAGAFGPDLAKKLSQLVKMEKNVMRSMEMVAKERMDVAVCFCLCPPKAHRFVEPSVD